MSYKKISKIAFIYLISGCAAPIDYSEPIANAVPASASIKGQIVHDAIELFPDMIQIQDAEISRVATFSDGSQGVCVRSRLANAAESQRSHVTMGITIHNGKLSGNQINHPLCSRPDVTYSAFSELRDVARRRGSIDRGTRSLPSTTPVNEMSELSETASSTISDQVAPSDGTACGNISHIAGMIMEGRQLGVPISTMMGAFKTDSASDKLYRALVEGVYQTPDYLTDQHRRNAVREFANQTYLQCLKSD